MATVYSGWSANWKPSGSSVNKKFRTWLTYTTSTSNTHVTITASMGIELNSAVTATFTTNYISTQLGSAAAVTQQSVGSKSTNFDSGTLTWTWIGSQQIIQVPRTTAAQTLKVRGYSMSSTASWNEHCTAIATITIPALASYAISYNANGGTGTISNQTKWYGKNLTLASSGFTRENYTLAGWNAGSTSGTAYNLGATYSANAATTMYARWTLNYTKPTITNLQAFRVDSSSSTTESSTGQYIRLQFNFTPGKVGTTNRTLECAITANGTSVYTSTNLTGSSFNQVLSGTYSNNSSHTITIKLYDDTDTVGITQTVSVGSATFPIDILGNGGAMGLMSPAQSGQAITMQEPHIILLGTSSTKILKDIAHPIGSCITMATNTNPSTVLGFGSWTLIDKLFNYKWVTDGFTFNTTNTTGGASLAILHGNSIEFRLYWKNKVAISDNDMIVGTFNLAKIGITAGHVCYPMAYSDGLNAIAMCNLNLSTSPYNLTINDFAIRGTTYPTSTSEYNIDLSYNYLVEKLDLKRDEFCNQFIFQRTA